MAQQEFGTIENISPVSNISHVSVDVAGKTTGTNPWTWRRWAYEGRIASVKLGRRLLIPVSEVERIMREHTRPAVR